MYESRKMMNIYKMRLVHNFPQFNAPCEKSTHILTCKSAGNISLWNKSIEDLKA